MLVLLIESILNLIFFLESGFCALEDKLLPCNHDLIYIETESQL